MLVLVAEKKALKYFWWGSLPIFYLECSLYIENMLVYGKNIKEFNLARFNFGDWARDIQSKLLMFNCATFNILHTCNMQRQFTEEPMMVAVVGLAK